MFEESFPPKFPWIFIITGGDLTSWGVVVDLILAELQEGGGYGQSSPAASGVSRKKSRSPTRAKSSLPSTKAGEDDGFHSWENDEFSWENDEFTLDCLREKEVLWKMNFGCRSARGGFHLCWTEPTDMKKGQRSLEVMKEVKMCSVVRVCRVILIKSEHHGRLAVPTGWDFAAWQADVEIQRNDTYLAIPEIKRISLHQLHVFFSEVVWGRYNFDQPHESASKTLSQHKTIHNCIHAIYTHQKSVAPFTFRLSSHLHQKVF